jgi:exosortase
VLQAVGYPIGHSGVVITIGQYQLLVVQACAGLTTMFTLEAMGLLYLNLMGYKSWVRNVALALLVVPISLTANVIRVILIALLTYHFGDAVGQGYMHNMSGIVLFATALAFIFAVDGALGRVLPKEWRA